MAEEKRRSFTDRVLQNVRLRDNRDYKRSTGFNFFRDDPNSVVNSNVSFIQGYNTPAGEFDIKGLGNGQSNSIVVSALQILGVSFSEATLKIGTSDDDGEKIEIANHPLQTLMRRPNPFMSGDVVQQYIINAVHVNGNAYLLKQKNEAGQLVALYPLMPEDVTPMGTPDELITSYKYQTDKETFKLNKKDVVHFKLGLDPKDHKSGFSPLKSVLREIYGDESAGQLATALLSNMGVPSVLLTPKGDYGVTDDEAEQMSKTYQNKVGGKNRGKPLILSGSMQVEKLSFSPKDLDITALRRLPEERVTAVLGVPAILAGMGAGLERATYSNARELREFFTENKLIPLWKMIAEDITQQILLPDYETSSLAYAEYDFSEVRALQGDEKDLYEKLNIGIQGGWITVAEARKIAGLPANETQEYYLLSNQIVQVPADTKPEPVAMQQAPEINETPEVVTEDDEDKEYGDKVIKKVGDQFCVITEQTGRNMGCYPTRELAQRRLDQISRFSQDPKERVGRDTFTTIEEARKRAEEIGCSGTHTHDVDGNRVYMPCSTHAEYEQRISDNGENY